MRVLLATLFAMFLVGCTQNTTPEIVKNVENGVVLIVNDKTETSGGIGTGFILSDNQIVTNQHVIEGSSKLFVFAKKTGTKYQASVVYSDKVADIAVLRLYDWELFEKNESPVNLVLGNSNKSVAGSKIIVIGHPWGLIWTVSEGIVSAKNRRPTPTPKFIDQVDAKLFQGNSGGPVFNEHGEVVCVSNLMVVVKESGSYGFCIPSNLVRKVLYDFNTVGEVRWRALNVSLKVSDNSENVVIEKIDEGGAADLAGLKVGDKIIEYRTIESKSGKKINSVNDLLTEISLLKADEEFIDLLIERNNSQIITKVKTNYKTEKDFEPNLDNSK